MCVCVPAQIVAIIHAANRLVLVNVSGAKQEVNISCIVDGQHPMECCIGDWVLIHAGFAISRIDEVEAAQTLQLLHELGDVEGELASMHATQRPAIH